MKTLTGPLFVVAWLAGSAVCYLMVRGRSGEPEWANVIGSLVWWWLMLPMFAVTSAIAAGRAYGAELIESARERRSRPALRAGADNGLYE